MFGVKAFGEVSALCSGSYVNQRVFAELCSEMEPLFILITDWYVQQNCCPQPRKDSTFKLEPASRHAF
jgi:hypothetical protein